MEKRNIPGNVNRILKMNDIADLLRRFESEYLSVADGVVLVTVSGKGHVNVLYAGISELETLGVLAVGEGVILSSVQYSADDEEPG
jgi:hypothetical protein